MRRRSRPRTDRESDSEVGIPRGFVRACPKAPVVLCEQFGRQYRFAPECLDAGPDPMQTRHPPGFHRTAPRLAIIGDLIEVMLKWFFAEVIQARDYRTRRIHQRLVADPAGRIAVISGRGNSLPIVPPTRALRGPESAYAAFLARMFARIPANRRLAFVSAMTLTQRKYGESAGYLELIDLLQSRLRDSRRLQRIIPLSCLQRSHSQYRRSPAQSRVLHWRTGHQPLACFRH